MVSKSHTSYEEGIIHLKGENANVLSDFYRQ